jgi:rubrerythrin
MEAHMSKTIENLLAAFAGESQANRKYLAFAEMAEKEGYKQIAKLFRAVAQAETVHAMNHLKAAGEIKSTEENLKAAIGGESYEVDSMYPPMLEEAEAAGDKKAANSFKWALEVEKVHALLYKKILDLLGKEMPEMDYYVCPVCGYTHEGKFEGRCPVCNTPGERFERID